MKTKRAMNRALLVPALALLVGAMACGETTYVFEDINVGDDKAGRTPTERTNAQFIRAVYADLVGRATQSRDITVEFQGQVAFNFPIDEQVQLENILGGLGDSRALRAVMVAGLVDHEEVDLPAKSEVSEPAEFISEQFRTYLGREPSVYELQVFVSEWAADSAVNPKTVVRALIGSREYQTL